MKTLGKSFKLRRIGRGAKTQGRILQPQRGEPWSEMEEYKKHFDAFSRLKPD